MKGLPCTDALLLISHHLQKSLDAEMDSNIVQLDFGAAFDRVSDSGLLFKLKFIGFGGSVLFICWELLSNSRQRVVVDGAIVESGYKSSLACHREVYWAFFCLSFIPVKCLSWWSTDYMPMLMSPL